jgi:UDP-N-acetylmuramoylalanine--D-glutamate ligase
MRIAELADRRVAVWGYGREGRAAVAAIRARLPKQKVTVFCSDAEAADLAIDLERRDDADIESSGSGFGQGSQETHGLRSARSPVSTISIAPDAAALSAFDVVVKSPGIGAYRPEILEAQHNGTLFTSGSALWFAEHPDAPVIAVTGTKGKSTVSALIAHFLRALDRRTALAGNIGLPLLDLLDPSLMPDWWVVELSSFQTRAAPQVTVGVINNLYEEHLDWHVTRERYAADKLALGDAAQTLIVNALQPELLTRTAAHPHRIVFGDVSGWHVRDGAIFRSEQRARELTDLPLPGLHNALNVCAALAAVEAAGEDAMRALDDVGSFVPLPHRLQTLGDRGGLVWVDDSIATTPQATFEALESLAPRKITVLVGGHERGLDWRGFAEAVQRAPPHAIVTMGANGNRIADVLRALPGDYRLKSAAALADAVSIARDITPANGIVLLSPGAPSFDQFRDYAERGWAFATLAGFDATFIGSIRGLGIA